MDMYVTLLIWFASSTLSALIASTKGRSGFVWAVIGALFGPITLLFISMMSKKKERIEGKKCAFCAETINNEATVCRYCGNDVVITEEEKMLKNIEEMLK